MSDNSAVLLIRFLFELVALGGFSIWAWRKTPGHWRVLTAIALPIAVGWIWGSFAVPGDASRSGETDVDTPGPVRLVLELAVFFGGALAFYKAEFRRTALTMAAALLVFHAVSYDRIWWLLHH